jgi:AcrR family transcriptional regulator
MTMSRRSGRRAGTSQTREQIAAAARTLFAEAGYERATFRAIAAEAGVDPALVVHFYGSKDELFREVMQLPPELAGALAGLAEGPADQAGRRLAGFVVGAMENPASRSLVLGRVRCASSHPDAAAMVRELVGRDVVRLTAAISGDRPELRAVLIGSQLVGILIARYVVGVEPLASLPPDQLIEQLAPPFQRVLTGRLDEPG